VPPPAWTTPGLVLAGIVSVQLGAALAGRMFGVVAPAGITGLRLWWAALILAAAGSRGLAGAVRGVLADRAWRDAAVVLAFGVTLGVMNFSIYQSFARIPLGAAVTIEFLGPLAVAVASSRRLADGLWVLLAATGVALLTGGGLTGGGLGGGGLGGGGRAVAGVAFGLAAAASWAAYILLSRATGRRFSGSAGLSIAMVVAAVVVTPPAVAAAGRSMFRPGVLGIGLAVGLLSSVIPYRLELEALRRVPARVFGIWMSLEPAVAALAGLVILGQALSARQWLAVGCVMAASAGAARGGRGPARGPGPGQEQEPGQEPGRAAAGGAGREQGAAPLPLPPAG
jgi:inner membrane transporter RhtA